MIISQGLLTSKPFLASVLLSIVSPKAEVPKVPITQVNIIITINAVLKNTVCRVWVNAYRQIMSHFNFTAALCSCCHFLHFFFPPEEIEAREVK